MCYIWRSYSNIPKAMFYLLKGYRFKVRLRTTVDTGFRVWGLVFGA